MTPGHWREIEACYHAALEREDLSSRAAYLAQLAPEIRKEVEELLSQNSAESPLNDRSGLFATTLTPGSVLGGHYRIEASIGAGGMGEVYRATDTKLKRNVAIKICGAGFVRRFEREARAIAALNHPNICTLYESGPDYLVMELVEGETLAARLKRTGPLPRQQALAYAHQIASALIEAHSKGIIHRDLKPGNIMLGKSGVKVVDFGLAKVDQTRTTEDQTKTTEGLVLGTVQYMSPEQAQGKEVDARSDIFAFGLILYEMIAGKRAFDGSNPASIVAAILEKEPPALESEDLDRVIKACLAKDPAERIQTARDLKRALDWNESLSSESQSKPREGLPFNWRTAAIALAIGLTPFAVSQLFFKKPLPTPAPRMRFQIPAQDAGAPKISPDGRKLIHISGNRLWLYSMESGETRELATTGGSWVPFWSPDSKFVGYISDGKIKRVDINGGPALTVTDFREPTSWGCGDWNRNDVIAFGDRLRGIFRVKASGGPVEQITALDPPQQETSQFCPVFLPDGRHFLYIRVFAVPGKTGIYVGSLLAKPHEQRTDLLLASNSQAEFLPSPNTDLGSLLFLRDGALMTQGFDHKRMVLTGETSPVAGTPRIGDDVGANAGYGGFSSSATGILGFRSVSEYRLTWAERDGSTVESVGEPAGYGGLAYSPDQTKVAVEKQTVTDVFNLWIVDLSRGGASTRFTFSSKTDADPTWSPDGRELIFSSNREGLFHLYRKPSNGAREEEVLFRSGDNKHPTSWSRDGQFLLFTVLHPKANGDIWILPLHAPQKASPVLATQFNEREAAFSPDGQWLAYASDESGQNEVYVRRLITNPAAASVELGEKISISNGLGRHPRWRGDGRELYFSSQGALQAVEVKFSPVLWAGQPRALGVTSMLSSWDCSADGKRFLSLKATNKTQPFTILLNWQAAVGK